MRRLFLILVVGMLACNLSSTPPAATPPPTSGAETAPPQPTVTAITPTAKPTPAPLPPNATVFPDPGAYQWVELISGLIRPVDIQNAGDGSGRLFILEQPGRIRVVENGQLLDAPFLDISGRVEAGGNEQGLLGLAFDPNYKQNGFLYVNYTGSGGNTVIARFQVTSNPNQADPNSEKRLLGVVQPFPNHNGGVVVFGPDGYLYLGLGDGGSQGDPNGNGQNTHVLLGKILRIDVEHGDPYAIPSNNPFGNEIWHYGLRNPWRISFDRATGDLFIADVGQDKWEEIDFVPAGLGGLNFGWNLFEGNHAYAGGSEAGITMPVAEYNHSQGCAVTGGYVYRGAMLEWQGIYLYGDYCSGLVWGLAHTAQSWQNRLLFETGFNISTFGEDESGEIYLADLRGSIYRLKAK
jgi:glucose/arabinose dehydrogenase